MLRELGQVHEVLREILEKLESSTDSHAQIEVIESFSDLRLNLDQAPR
jgi:hypothetical protein